MSDGHHYFIRFLARGQFPGKNSLIRIRPNAENGVIRIKSSNNQQKLYVFLGDFVKILDGGQTRGRVGNPVRLEGSSTTNLNIPRGGYTISKTEYQAWLKDGNGN